jgi:tetratricopeptide (TPR) repeat protein
VLWVNLGWSVINLLPFPGVDGGAILGEITTIVLGRPAEVAVRIIGLVVVGAVCLGLALVGQYDWALIVGWVAVLSTVRMGVLSDVMVGKRQGNSPGHLILKGLYQEAFDSACVAMADHPGDLELTLVAADALRLMSRYSDAETGYDEVLKRDPMHPRALRGRACARRLQGRDTEAEADLQALLAVPRADAVLAQAVGLYDADRYEDGLHLVVDVLPTAENVVVGRALNSIIAMFEKSLGREDDALRHTDELISAEPGRADLHEQRALILCDLGRLDEAAAAAHRALAGAPKHPEFLETLSIAERMAGNPFAAMSRLVDAAVARPALPRARAEVALCQLQLGRSVEARAALDSLPGYAARDPFVTYSRAALAAAAGETDQAIGLLNEVRRLRPELGVRAQVDPLFRALAADSARRAAVTQTRPEARPT